MMDEKSIVEPLNYNGISYSSPYSVVIAKCVTAIIHTAFAITRMILEAKGK